MDFLLWGLNLSLHIDNNLSGKKTNDTAFFANLSEKADILQVSKYCSFKIPSLFHHEDCQQL